MEPEDSFLVVLHSNKSRESFVGNNSSNFSNKLHQSLKLENFDVSLQSLYYYDDFKLQPEDQILPEEKTGKPFFDTAKHQNVLWLNQLDVQELNVKKTYEFFPSFVTGLNLHFQKFLVNARLILHYGDGGIPERCTLFYALDYGYRLHLGNLSSILGFSLNDFNAGSYDSDQPINLEEFSKLGNDAEFRITRRRWKLTKLTLDELVDPTLDDICVAITGSAAKSGFRVAATCDDDESTLTINTFSDDIVLTLSTYLNEYLKLPRRQEFRLSTTVTVPRTVLNPFEPLEESYIRVDDERTSASPSKVLVECSICVPNYFESVPLKIIQIFSRREGKGEIKFLANPQLYTPVAKFEVNYINIQLKDENLNHLPVQNKPSVAVLHFKKKWM